MMEKKTEAIGITLETDMETTIMGYMGIIAYMLGLYGDCGKMETTIMGYI